MKNQKLRVRKPAVAGYFYPSDPRELTESIRNSFLHSLGPGKLPPSEPDESLIGVISPHAGYIYSGPIAAHVYYKVSGLRGRVKTIVIVGPNHYGIGSGVAVPESVVWETPLGSIEIDTKLSRTLVRLSRMVDIDDSAHWREHSIEVQVPFIQYSFGKEVKILPISMAMQDMLTAVEVGDALARAVKEVGERVLLVASTDFTHYEPHEEAYRRDAKALEAIMSMDTAEFYRVIERYNVSMCGYGAVAVILTASRALGANKVELLKYATSGDTAGDKSSVVGYGSLAISRSS